MSDISERIKKLVVTVLGVDEARVVPDASFISDLGAGSLDTVEIAMALEREFKIEVSDGDFEEIKTIHDVETFIENMI